MAYSWLACLATTGQVITGLPDLSVPTVGATLCDAWTGEASLPVPGAPAEWRRATMPMASYLVLLDDDVPVWGGWITSRTGTEGDTVSLGVATWEAYLGRRYTGNLAYVGAEQCFLAADIVASAVVPDGPAMLVEYTAGSTTRDRTYEDEGDKTVLSALQELSGVEGGPEWTVVWRHLTGPERYVPVVTIRDRIGVSPPPGLDPAATFELPGSVSAFELVEDWTEQAAANHVIATSTAEADERPQSAPQIHTDPDRPRLEYRYTPSTSITSIDTLNSHAARALPVMRDGAVALVLTAAREAAPRMGVEWGMGDDIGYRLAAPSVCDCGPSGDLVPLSGTGRCIAWVAGVEGVETVTPILASEEAF